MLFFTLTFTSTVGNFTWIYATEVAVDQASGLFTFSFCAALCLFSFTAEYLMDSFLQVAGTFYLFGIINFLAFLFCMCFVKETFGLTNKQMKELYSKKNKTIPETIEASK